MLLSKPSKMQVPKTPMTQAPSGLETRGLIALQPNPEDGRSKLVRLTGKGRKVRDAAMAATGADVSMLTDQLPPQRLAALLPDLRALRKLLDDNRPDA